MDYVDKSMRDKFDDSNWYENDFEWRTNHIKIIGLTKEGSRNEMSQDSTSGEKA